MAAKKGRGLFMVYVDVPAPLEDEFNRWYNEEHLPERLAIPGVLTYRAEARQLIRRWLRQRSIQRVAVEVAV